MRANQTALTRWRRHVPVRHRRVMLALLSDAANLSGGTIFSVARVNAGSVYVTLDRLEDLGWVDGTWELRTDDRPRRRFYRLTPEGRIEVMRLLKLEER